MGEGVTVGVGVVVGEGVMVGVDVAAGEGAVDGGSVRVGVGIRVGVSVANLTSVAGTVVRIAAASALSVGGTSTGADFGPQLTSTTPRPNAAIKPLAMLSRLFMMDSFAEPGGGYHDPAPMG